MFRFPRHAIPAWPLWPLIVLSLTSPGRAHAQFVEIERNEPARVRQLTDFGPLVSKKGTPGTKDTIEVARDSSFERGYELFGRQGASYEFERGVTATLQVVRVNIGEPGGFIVPLYLFLNAAQQTGANAEGSDDIAAATLLNPVGGMINVSAREAIRVLGKDKQFTSLQVTTHAAGKLMTAGDLTNPEETRTTVVGYGDVGLFFQTRAWREADKENPGVFWLEGKVGGTVGPPSYFQSTLGADLGGSLLHWSVYGGIEIARFINVRTGISRAFSSRGAVALEEPVVRLLFDVTPGRGKTVRRLADKPSSGYELPPPKK